jgi:hypothetical protein
VPTSEALENSLIEIAEEDLDYLSPDAAKQHDHYIYGTLKS